MLLWLSICLPLQVVQKNAVHGRQWISVIISKLTVFGALQRNRKGRGSSAADRREIETSSEDSKGTFSSFSSQSLAMYIMTP